MIPMIDLLSPENLATWIAQTSILAAVAGLLGRIFRARAARWHLVYLHCLLAVLRSPAGVQPWQRQEIRWTGSTPGRRRTCRDPPFRSRSPSTGLPFALAAGFGCRAIWLCLRDVPLEALSSKCPPIGALPPSVSAAD